MRAEKKLRDLEEETTAATPGWAGRTRLLGRGGGHPAGDGRVIRGAVPERAVEAA